jgi:hypothetical protein
MVATRNNSQVNSFIQEYVSGHPQSKKVGFTAAMRKLLLLVFALWNSERNTITTERTLKTPWV